MDREELQEITPIRLLIELFRDGFVVHRKGGRGGWLTYSEGWRYTRFTYELMASGWGVDLDSATWWRLPFGIPIWRLSIDAKQRILQRLQKTDQYVAFGPTI